MIYFTNGVSHEKILFFFFFFSIYFYMQNHHPLYHDFRNIPRTYLLYSLPDSLNEHTRCFIDCRHSRTPGNPGFVVASIVFLIYPQFPLFISPVRASPFHISCIPPLVTTVESILEPHFIYTHLRSNHTLSPWKSFLHPSISLITLGRENMSWKMLRSTITVRIMFFFFSPPPPSPRPSLRSVKNEW